MGTDRLAACDVPDAVIFGRLVFQKNSDESGFEKTSPLTYTYVKRGQQHRIPKPHRRGRLLSILGFWQPGQRFDYGIVVGGFNSQRYLTLMQWQAERALISLGSDWANHGHYSRWSLLSPLESSASLLATMARDGFIHFLLATVFPADESH